MFSNNLPINPTLPVIQFFEKIRLLATFLFRFRGFLTGLTFLVPFLLSGQTNSFCGYYQAVPPNGTNPDSLVYDRFGNAFDLEDLAVPPQPASTSVCNSGYFNPTWVGNPSQTVQDVVCEVLGYVSTVVQQRQGQNNCGVLPTELVEIQVGWVSFSNPDPNVVAELGMALNQFPLPSNLAGIGSPFYSFPFDNACDEITLERAFIKINGGRVQGSNVIFDARIILNSDVTWNYNSTANTFSGIDLFTVTLHEMMHAMGFGSIMGSIGAFSLWDKSLRIVDNYEPTGGSANPQDVIVSATNCGRNCWETVLGFGNVAINSCVGTGPDIVLGDAAIAPIAGNPLVDPNQLDDLANMLSHLSMTCSGQNQPYVMRPVLNPGEFQRTITLPEQQIFCELGYFIPSINCDGCYVIAQQDAQLAPNAECCFKTFHVCVGESLEILNDALLCNDLSGESTIAVTALWHQPASGPLITVVPNSSGTGWIVTVPPDVSQFLNISLLYTLTGCDCRQHNGRVRLFLDHYCPTTEFTPDLCDNLLRDGDFEDATDNTSNPNIPPLAFGGWPILFQGNVVPATPDIHQTSAGNHYLGMENQTNATNQEAINLELQKCIEPGCELLLSMDLSNSIYNGTTIPALQVWGSESRPCPATIINPVPISFDCNVQTACSANDIFDPICIFSNIPALNPWLGSDNPNFTNSGQLSWINQTNQDVCFLTFVNPTASPTSSRIYLDNIVAEIRCAPEITCTNTTVIAEVCQDETANISFQVCAPSMPECVASTLVTPTVVLPSGWAVVGANPNPFTLTAGQCVDINLQVQMPPGTPIGTLATIGLSGTATGLCTEVTWACESTVSVINCLPAFSCPCTDANTINIDAGNVDDPNSYLSISQTVIPGLTTQSANGQNVFVNTCLAIRGRLRIDNGYDLTIIGGEIRMQPGAEIVVKNGSTLELLIVNSQGGIHGCVKMWQGIIVERGATMTMVLTSLKDAQHAIELEDNSTLQLGANYFDKNYVGIYSAKVPNSNIIKTINTPFPIQGNTFTATEELLPPYNIYNPAPYRGLAGAEVNNASLTIGTNDQIVFVGDNWFSNLRNGVIGQKSFISVINGHIDNLILSNVSSSSSGSVYQTHGGIGVWGKDCFIGAEHCEINSAIAGIVSFSHNVSYYLWAKHNEIGATSPVRTGIQTWRSLLSPQIEDNTIRDYSDMGIDISYPLYGGIPINVNNNRLTGALENNYSGIRLQGIPGGDVHANNLARVQGNTINVQNGYAGITLLDCNNIGLQSNDVTNAYIGFEAYNLRYSRFFENTASSPVTYAVDYGGLCYYINQSPENYFCCNSADGRGGGFLFNGNADNTKFRHNQFGDFVYSALNCQSSSILGTQINAGNQWNGNSTSDVEAVHFGNFAARFGSQFTVGTCFQPEWPESIFPLQSCLPNSLEWFNKNTAISNACVGDARYCTSPFGELPEPEDERIEDNDLMIAQGVLEGEEYGTMLDWETSKGLFAKLARNPGLIGENPAFQTFYNEGLGNNLVKFYRIDTLLARYYKIDPERINAAQVLADSILAKWKEAGRIDSLYQHAETQADTLALKNQKYAVLTEISERYSDLLDVADELKEQRTALALAIRSLNAAIVPQSYVEENEKIVNDAFLTLIALAAPLNSTQKTNLWTVAEQCPLSGGHTVGLARSLYSAFVDGTVQFDLLDCVVLSAPQERNSKAAAPARAIEIYPNPAQESVSVVVNENLADGSDLCISIFSVSGGLRFVKEVDSYEEGDIIHVPLTGFAPGIYFIHVQTQDGIFEQKLVVEK